MIVLVPLLVYLAYLIPQNITYSPAENVRMQVLSPLTQEQLDPVRTVYTFDISDKVPGGDTLFVQSKHCSVSVMSNGQPVYSLERGDRSWMSTTGTVYDLIYLPEELTQLTITVTKLYSNVSSSRATFSVGNGAEIFESLSRASFFPTIISITEIFIGLLLLIMWHAFRKKVKSDSQKALFYLALFSIAVGTWSLSGSVHFILIVNNQAAASATSFIALMFFVIPVVQFTRYYFGYCPHFADAVSLSAIISTIATTTLHLSGIAGFRQTLVVTHIHIAVISAFYIYSFTRFSLSGEQRHRKYLNIAASVILMGSTLIDFIIFFIGNMQLSSAGRFGFLIYFFILGTETIADSIHNLQESQNAEIYKRLAYKDNLTGLRNRNAYIDMEKNLLHADQYTIINFDLNDLKYCNDHLGHAYGDKYIADAAKIISEVFEQYGDCYRMGGDEFTVVIPPERSAHFVNTYPDQTIEELLKVLTQKQDAYNRASNDVQIHIAYGYSKYDPKKDKSPEAVSTRADARMYDYKRSLKEIRAQNKNI